MNENTEDTIVVDVELREPPAPPPVPREGVRFFCADDGGVDYWFVARDIEHAKALLVKSGCEFYDEDGDVVHELDKSALEWRELTLDEAAGVRTRCDENGGSSMPLSHRQLGDWFCSEW